MVARKRSHRKNIMRAFSISEISACDSPAQIHARAIIMKRFDPDERQEPNMHKILTQRDDAPLSFDTLEDAMKYLSTQHPDMPQSDVMSKAARQYPDLHDEYNDEGEWQIRKAETEALDATRKPPAVREFESLVSEIKRRDKCDSVTALRRARSENPALFERFQSAA
ncbi:MAG: hypothetical protein GEU76_01125 [Alphaproteobacteria bacterium]|nr:hypothetical protein [Alphaproteobacteria bacterium]